jgi:prepilin-type processing-associated H-X9-DG protein
VFHRISVLLSVLVVVTLTTLTSAQPLVDRVPGDAVIYVAWGGAETMGAEYDSSHLKAILDATDMPKQLPEFVRQLLAKVGAEDPEAKQKSEIVAVIADTMWKHPTAVYFAGVDFPDAGPPMPKAAVLCNAGADAPALVAKLKAILDEAGEESPVPLSVVEKGGLVQLVIGKAGDETTKLADAAGFKAAMKHAHAKPVAAVYIDGEALMKQVGTGIEKSGDRRAMAQWPKMRQQLGLDGFKAGIWTAAFEDRSWSTRGFVAAPAPRTGVLKFLESQPLPDDTLKVVPQTAIMAGAGRFNLGASFDAVRELIAGVQPGTARQFDRAVQDANQKLGLDIRQDLIAPLGDTWTYYVDPMTGGTSMMGGVLINKLADSAKAEQSFLKLQKSFNELTAKQFKREKMSIVFKQTTIDGQAIHYLAVPLVTPSWTIKNGHWIVGLYPQTVSAAARNLGSGGKSLLDNPAYVELRKKLGNTPAVASVQFADLPKLAPNAYGTWLQISRLFGFGDMFGLDAPLLALPPMYKLQQHLAASGMVSWTTDEGFFVRAVSPFPGSTVISSDPLSGMSISQPALMASILLPSLNKARETANRVKCQSNLSQIGMAMLLYSNENKGKAPPDLGTLLLTQDLTVDVFTCPSGHGMPHGVRNMKPEDQAKWVNEGGHYEYLKPKVVLTKLAADDVIVYEKVDAHDGDGMNILYADGHAEFHMMRAAQEEIERTKKRQEGGGL